MSKYLRREDVPKPHFTRLNPEHPRYNEICEVHINACIGGQDTYIDPGTGYIVITALSHLNRGYCCGKGCRHCPYILNEFSEE